MEEKATTKQLYEAPISEEVEVRMESVILTGSGVKPDYDEIPW